MMESTHGISRNLVQASAVQGTSVTDQRSFERHVFDQPVNVSTGVRRDRVGMARDLSPQGVQFESRSCFAVGERVVIVFRTPKGKSRTSTSGTIVRSWSVLDGHSLFPHGAAVRFDEPNLDFV